MPVDRSQARERLHHVFCGPSTVFTNAYNPRSEIPRKSEYRNTLVRQGATLVANCTIVRGITIHEHAFIGAGAVVNRDVPAYALMLGVSARLAGWVSAYGEHPDLPVKDEGETVRPHSVDYYQPRGRLCTRTET